MKITSDWHIHSHNSCDEASLLISNIVNGTAAKGIVEYGVTDHIHTPYNLPDLFASRAEFEQQDKPPGFHFGVEVSVVSRWEIEEIQKGHYNDPVYGLRGGGEPGCELAIGLTPELIRELSIEYVIGGTHWPMYLPPDSEKIMADYHRQNMFLATHELITIIAHPWWGMGYWNEEEGKYCNEPWIYDFDVIPKSMHNEFAMAAIENNKFVEINMAGCLLNPVY
ncbi:MAG: hypothetical protein GX811_05080, partial [Lentisphaerae bacterium]|nr:hypothetical protein [Lentisphaerota bacterium]